MQPSAPERRSRERRHPAVRSPQDLAAGLLLLVIAAAGFWGSWELSLGEASVVGSGMLPRLVAVMLAVLGTLLVTQAFLASEGSPLSAWSLRGLFFVLGAAILFAWTIRPLGLLVAAPITIVFASLADRSTRPLEIIIFTAVLTAFCIGLFSFALRLPIPVLPSSLPHPLNQLF